MTEVSEQVERVAKAIADDCDDTWNKLLPEQKDHFRCNAIAAIRALEASQAEAEQVLRDALKSAAESLHHAGCYVAETEALAALTTPTRIEASQAGAGEEPVAEIVMFGGDLKEVAWRKGKMPPAGTKLYTRRIEP